VTPEGDIGTVCFGRLSTAVISHPLLLDAGKISVCEDTALGQILALVYLKYVAQIVIINPFDR
jgi:hypothetical protein